MFESRVWPSGSGVRAPRLVIDEHGSEVAVLIEYGQYIRLLRMVAAEVGVGRLPAYWRAAVDDCLVAGR